MSGGRPGRGLAALALLLTAQAPVSTPAPTPTPSAETEAASKAMDAFLKSPANTRLSADALARVPPYVLKRCPSLKTVPAFVAVLSPLRFAPDGAPIAGAWRDSQVARGCGADLQLNYYFFATPQRRTMIVLGVPGTSRADLSQQRDARTYALVALDGVAGRCQSFETVNTRFEGWGSKAGDLRDPGEKAPFRPWWESWTMAGCGKRWTVPLEFRPNQLGTQIIQPGGAAEEHGG